MARACLRNWRMDLWQITLAFIRTIQIPRKQSLTTESIVSVFDLQFKICWYDDEKFSSTIVHCYYDYPNNENYHVTYSISKYKKDAILFTGRYVCSMQLYSLLIILEHLAETRTVCVVILNGTICCCFYSTPLFSFTVTWLAGSVLVVFFAALQSE